jgi:putative glutamine amidotransferase
MKFNIGIIPTIINRHGSNSLFFDIRLINFIKKIFKKKNIVLLKDKSIKNLNVIISSGGNDIKLFSRQSKDIFRGDLENYYLNLAIKKKISFVGICYGAQFLANKFKAKIVKDKKHVKKNHYIYSSNKKKKSVNSFHNYKITTLKNNLQPLYFAEDKSIEAFKHKKLKIIGIMWHPERERPFKKFDISLIKSFI